MYKCVEIALTRLKDFFVKPSAAELHRRKQQADYEYLRSRGVETELGYVTLIGKPIINIALGAHIKMGKGVILVSSNSCENGVWNEAAVNHPVMLSASTSGAVIQIEDGVGMSGTNVVAATSVVIGKNTQCGVNTNIWDTDFHILDPHKRLTQNSISEAASLPIVIGENVWLSSEVTVLKGVSIGDNAVVGAKSLVTKSIKPSTLNVGIPTKKIRVL